MYIMNRFLPRIAVSFALSLLFISCGGGGGGGEAPAPAPVPGVNQPPAFASASYTDSATVALSYSSAVAQATDPESDTIAYSRNGGTCNAWATVAANGTISGTPAVGDIGSCTVIVQATATGGSDTATVTISVFSQLSTVDPLYSNGINWNDYVNDDGSDIFSATDAACNTATCIHGGEIRSMEVPGYSSCSDLTVSESLGAFDWTCVAGVSSVRFISTGLKQGKHLSDLIDFTTPGSEDFKPNFLTVLDSGTPIAQSNAANWWPNNPVVTNNDGSAMTSGNIYIVTNPTDAQYAISADKIALVSKPGETLTATNSFYVVEASNSSFLWLEVKVDASNSSMGLLTGIRLSSTSHSVLDNIELDNTLNVSASAVGVELYSSSYNRLSNITVDGNNTSGVLVWNSSNDNKLSNIIARNNGNVGIGINSSDSNSLRDIRVYDNVTDGVSLNSSDGTALSSITAYRNNRGIFVGSAADNSFGNITVSNNDHSGIQMYGSSNNILMNLVATENSYGAALYEGSSDNILINLTATEGSNFVLSKESGGTSSSVSNRFTGMLQVGDSTGCYVEAGSGDLGDGTCDPNIGSSDATLNQVGSAASAFINPTLGMYMLLNADTVLLDKLAVPTGSDVFEHTWSDGFTQTTVLRNAVEISGDDIGNDNMLCESGETCLYTPNISAYQGHGNLVSAGAFTDGTISGVTLLKYEHNGY